MLGLGAMLRDFFAFLVLAIVCSFGFLLSFVLISEGRLTVKDAAWLLTKVFREWNHASVCSWRTQAYTTSTMP